MMDPEDNTNKSKNEWRRMHCRSTAYPELASHEAVLHAYQIHHIQIRNLNSTLTSGR